MGRRFYWLFMKLISWPLLFLLTLVGSSFSFASDVCQRTFQVRSALEVSLQTPCERISETELLKVKTLDLSAKGITSLLPQDFQGLSNLLELSLAMNQLVSLPVEVFRGLDALEALRLG